MGVLSRMGNSMTTEEIVKVIVRDQHAELIHDAAWPIAGG